MTGGLRETASLMAIAALLCVGATVFGVKPAKAADLGGDCCADLEERVAELAWLVRFGVLWVREGGYEFQRRGLLGVPVGRLSSRALGADRNRNQGHRYKFR
jgi:hypothetical protein